MLKSVTRISIQKDMKLWFYVRDVKSKNKIIVILASWVSWTRYFTIIIRSHLDPLGIFSSSLKILESHCHVMKTCCILQRVTLVYVNPFSNALSLALFNLVYNEGIKSRDDVSPPPRKHVGLTSMEKCLYILVLELIWRE